MVGLGMEPKWAVAFFRFKPITVISGVFFLQLGFAGMLVFGSLLFNETTLKSCALLYRYFFSLRVFWYDFRLKIMAQS